MGDLRLIGAWKAHHFNESPSLAINLRSYTNQHVADFWRSIRCGLIRLQQKCWSVRSGRTCASMDDRSDMFAA